MLWAWLLGACLSSALTTLTSNTSAPRLLNCIFMVGANITCRWEPGPVDPQPSSAINYTLYIEKRSLSNKVVNPPLICTTSGTECSVKIGRSVSFLFCITVRAHTPNGVVPSPERCQRGRTEVVLEPATLGPVVPVGGSPLCLNLTWKIPLRFALSRNEIRAGQMLSQMKYSTQGQPNAQVSNVTVNGTSFVACVFKPDTNYTIRLRNRYREASEATPWSQWSGPSYGKTDEAAPAVAPQLWIQMNEADKNEWRHVVLLWKPLDPSLANGVVHSYNVRCQTSSAAHILSDHGSWSVLHHNRTSCSLFLPPERHKCFLTASNSAGTSPEAHIWLPGSTDSEFPPISQITVISLDDSRLDVRWTAPDDQVVTGFVVEWFAVAEQKNSSLQWKRLNGSCRRLIITEGVEPLVRYAVTVKALHGEQGIGLGRIHHVYTREGVPSAGPKVTVQEISSNGVELSWNSIPVEQQHGFIRNYILHYTYSDGQTKRVFIPGDVHQYSLRNLLPGVYNICMQGNTEAGTGVPGQQSAFNVLGSDDADILMIMILPVVLTSLAVFVLMACLAHNDLVKQTVWQDIPNPSHSSLGHWTPKALWKRLSVLKAETPHIQQVVLDDEAADEAAQQNSGPVEVFSYHIVQSPNMHSSHMNAPFCHALVHTPHATPVPLDELLPIAATESPITSAPEQDNNSETLLSPCDSIYTQVLTSKLSQTVSQPLLSYSDHGFTDCQYTAVGYLDCELQLGGDSEPHRYEQGDHVRGSALLLSQADKLENPPLTLAEKNGLIPLLSLALTSHVKPLPLSHLTNICHSSSSLSLSGEESSPRSSDFSPSAFCLCHFNPFSCSPPVHLSEPGPGCLCPFPDSLQNTFSSAFSPFHYDMKGLLSYPFLSNVFSEDCDMYISTAM